MNLLKSLLSNKKILFGIIILLAISLPLIINQVLQQQDTRQRAFTSAPIRLTFDPVAAELAVGQTAQITMYMDTNGSDIGSLEFRMNYNSSIIRVQASGFPNSPYQRIKSTSATNMQTLTYVNPTTTPVIQNSYKIQTFSVTRLAAGNATISVDNVKATAASYNTYAAVESTGTVSFVTLNTPAPPANIVAEIYPIVNPGTTSVNLSGLIKKPLNTEGIAIFRYGTTNTSCQNLASTIGSKNLLIGSTEIQIQSILSGLSPNTTYFTCIQTQSSTSNVTYSPVINFKTALIPSPTITPLPTRAPSPTPTITRVPTSTPRPPTITPTRIPSPTNVVPTITISKAPGCIYKAQGDANCDGKVDVVNDFIIWKGEFSGTAPRDLVSDFDKNGVVNALDFVLWKGGYSATNIPH